MSSSQKLGNRTDKLNQLAWILGKKKYYDDENSFHSIEILHFPASLLFMVSTLQRGLRISHMDALSCSDWLRSLTNTVYFTNSILNTNCEFKPGDLVTS